MSKQLSAEHLQFKKKTQISLQNLKKLQEVSEKLEEKELELQKNKEKIKKWKIFRGEQKDLLAERAAVIEEVSFVLFFCLFFIYYVQILL